MRRQLRGSVKPTGSRCSDQAPPILHSQMWRGLL